MLPFAFEFTEPEPPRPTPVIREPPPVNNYKFSPVHFKSTPKECYCCAKTTTGGMHSGSVWIAICTGCYLYEIVDS